MQLIGTAFTYWLTIAWRLGGLVFFGLFLALTVAESFRVGIVVFPGDNTVGSPQDEEFPIWWRRAKYVRVASLLASIGLLWFLYRRLW